MDLSKGSSMGSLSTRLVLQREQRNISLEEISLSTKINIRFLTAIEQGHFEELPGGIISKGFVRAYARQIGMDEEQAINGYLAAIEANQTEGASVESWVRVCGRGQESVAARLPWWAFAVALLIIGFGFIALRHYKRGLPHRDERGFGAYVRPVAPVNKLALRFFAASAFPQPTATTPSSGTMQDAPLRVFLSSS
jgi:cytoskeletal protein RodZ